MTREGTDVVLAEKDLTAVAHGVRAGPHESGNIAAYLCVLALPPSPLGLALGLTRLSAVYYLMLTAVLVLHATGLVAARAGYERRRAGRTTAW